MKIIIYTLMTDRFIIIQIIINFLYIQIINFTYCKDIL